MSPSGDGIQFVLIAIVCVGGFVGLAVLAIRSSKKWMAELIGQAAHLGWQKVDDPSRAPAAVIEAARSRRTVLLLHHPQRQVWLCWHRWTETSTSADGRQSSSRTHDLTTYFVAVPGSFPDMSVVRRTKLGGLLKPKRGVGTGDDDFDRRFVVKPSGSPQAARVVTPRMAEALRAGEVPEFSLSSNVLSTSHHTRPDWRELEPRAEQLGRLARLLASQVA